MIEKNLKSKIQNPNLEKIIKYLYYGLFFLTPLIMFSRTSELFEFNKMIFIYFFSLSVLFLLILQSIITRKIIVKKTQFDIPIVLLFLALVLSTFFSIDIHTSIFGYYGRFNGGLLSIIAYLILFYGFVANFSVNDGLKYIYKILKISLLSSFMVILWGLPGKFGHDLSCLLFTGQFNNSCWTDQFRPAERMFSTLGQPNWLGAYLVINFFIGLFFFLKNFKNTKYLVLYTLYLLVNFSAILFTRSRSSLGSVLVGLAIFPILLFFCKNVINRMSTLKRYFFILILLILPILFFKTGIDKIDRFLTINNYQLTISNKINKQLSNSAIQQLSSVTESGDIRKIVWNGAIELGKKYPFFGTGVETFAYSYYFVRPKEHNLTSEWDFLYNKAHNEYLNYLATTGFLGLTTYLVLIISVLFYSWKNLQQFNNQLLTICLLISYITILITNFFGFSTTTINLFFYLIPAFILVLNQKTSDERQNISPKDLNNSQKAGIFVASSFFLFGIYYFMTYFIADIKYAKGDNYSKIGDYQNAVKQLEQAYKIRYEHIYEDKLSYVLANLAFIASYQKENNISQQFRNTADLLNKKSLSASPKNVLYWKTRAKNHYLFYQISDNPSDIQEAITSLLIGQKLSPTDPKIPYSLSIFSSMKNTDQKLSLNYIQQAINLKPDYRDAYFLKGQLLKKANNKSEAKKTFEFILQNLNPQDEESKKELY